MDLAFSAASHRLWPGFPRFSTVLFLVTGARLDGRVALVTGAAQGIGAAIARGLAAEGARVAVTDRDGGGAAICAARITSELGRDRAFALPLDVTEEAAWRDAIEACRGEAGALDILVNNAGVMLVGTIEDLTLDQWRGSMAINADGAFLGCKYALPLLRESASASIVNISSIAAMVASPTMCAYGASKAALTMLTKSVALHCARKGWPIRVNSIHPTFVRTQLLDGYVGHRDRGEVMEKLARQVPIGRIGEVEDVVNAVLYLAGDESAMMTASELKLDGGLSAM